MKKKPFNVISAIFLAVLGVIRSHLSLPPKLTANREIIKE